MGGLKKVLIIIISIILTLVVGFVGSLWWMQSSKEKENIKQYEVYKFKDNIKTNITNDKRAILIVPEVVFIVDEKSHVKEELEKNEGKAYNVILTCLRSKTYDELADPQSHLKLGSEIVKKLNEIYHTDKFTEVNFKEFIIG